MPAENLPPLATRRRWRRGASAGVGSTCYESVLTPPADRERAISSKKNRKQVGDILENQNPSNSGRLENEIFRNDRHEW
jgi:hypothetical protein